MFSRPPTLETVREVDQKTGKEVVSTREIEYTDWDLQIIEADKKVNKNFDIDDVRKHDLLLLSSLELDLGKTKNFKDKFKTIQDLQKL